MFSTIFNFEIKRWFKSPVFYVYCAIFFGLSLFLMMSALGAFDVVTVTTSTPRYVNSPINIAGILNSLATLVYFLMPTIIGASVYRDYQTQMYQVLFSYPLTKPSYLGAKFLSSLVVTLVVVLCCVVGFYVAQFMPNVNAELLGPNNPWAYLQAFFIVIIPSMVLFGIIVFAVVNYSRNIYVGFIFVLFLMVLQSVFSVMTGDLDNKYLVALLDPFGFEPLVYYTKYWSVEEQNVNNLPFFGVVLYNRLIWLAVATVIGGFVYATFEFSHLGNTFGSKKPGQRLTKENFGSIIRVELPKVTVRFNFWSQLKTTWNISLYDFKSIVRNWTFIVIMVISVLFVVIVTTSVGQMWGTETYPVTWKMLESISGVYSFFTHILILLFAGILVQRARTAKMNLMVDSTAVSNWVLYFSKFFALVQMTLLIVFVSMLTGIAYQAFHGYFNFELGHYITELFGLDMLKYLVLIGFALFVHSWFENYFVGFIVCLCIYIGVPFLSNIGIEQSIYKFNQGPSYTYSDMNGYGVLRTYLYYRLYWGLFAAVLSVLTLLLWRRGIVSSVREKLFFFKSRLTPVAVIALVVFLFGFVGVGYAIYYDTNIARPYYSAKDQELQQVDFEKRYGKYRTLTSPRLVDVKLQMDLFPKERNYTSSIGLTYVNTSDEIIDTLFLCHNDNIVSEEFSLPLHLFEQDTVVDIKLYALEQSLQPGDTLSIQFALANKPNTFLQDRSGILENGTFLNNMMFPSFGYPESHEIIDNDVRKKYDLPARDRMPDTKDTASWANNYISMDADWIDFEATIGTDADQIAIAPGYLQKEWEEGGRRYFHYKMDNKILNFYSVLSARYEVMRDKHEDINLEIYYHPGHAYNLEKMMASMKKSLDYYQGNFSPYQFSQMRVIEFPKTQGSFAQAFANTVPFSEAIGFIAKVDEDDPTGIDYPYSVVAHEFAHQWWAHQVIGARVKGATMMSESLAEYSSLKVLEHTYGPYQMRRFLKDALNQYLSGRASERIAENPLMFNENQAYIHYNKGSLVMYAMSDLLGEAKFNSFLREYIDRVAFQYPPYTTSIEFVDLLKQHTPDSLQYAIKDMYETITLYDNKIESVSMKPLKDGKYQVDLEFQVSKYRSDAKGKRSYEDVKGQAIQATMGKREVTSLPLEDFVEIAIFTTPKKQGVYDVDNPIFSKKYKIDKIANKLCIIVDQEPIEVGVDPYNMLIDTESEDNRMKI